MYILAIFSTMYIALRLVFDTTSKTVVFALLSEVFMKNSLWLFDTLVVFMLTASLLIVCIHSG